MAGLVPAIHVLSTQQANRRVVQRRSCAVPTIPFFARAEMVGTLSLCLPYFPASFFIAALMDAAASS
jgi:hypothetical protein